jgi:ferredoxin
MPRRFVRSTMRTCWSICPSGAIWNPCASSFTDRTTWKLCGAAGNGSKRMSEAFLVLWWVPEGHRPSVAEAITKLEILRRDGPTAKAFTFRQSYPATGAPESPPLNYGDECPA